MIILRLVIKWNRNNAFSMILKQNNINTLFLVMKRNKYNIFFLALLPFSAIWFWASLNIWALM
jgi:hypothetical protein